MNTLNWKAMKWINYFFKQTQTCDPEDNNPVDNLMEDQVERRVEIAVLLLLSIFGLFLHAF